MPGHSRRGIIIVSLRSALPQPFPQDSHCYKRPCAEERDHTHCHKSLLQSLRRDPRRDGIREAKSKGVSDDNDDDHSFTSNVLEAVDSICQGSRAVANKTECHNPDAEHQA